MPGGPPSPARSSPTETNPSHCLCVVIADFMRCFFQRIITMLYEDNEEGQDDSQLPQPTCSWHPDTCQLGNPTSSTLLYPSLF